MPLDVGETAGILDHVGAVPAVDEGGAVLGDQERQVAVVALQADEQLRQRLGDDRPAHCGLVRVLRHLDEPEHGAVVGRRDEIRAVEVDAEVVERRRDRLHVAGADRVERPEPLLVEREDLGRVRAAEDRVEEPAVVVAVEPPSRGPVLVAVGERPRHGQVERIPIRPALPVSRNARTTVPWDSSAWWAARRARGQSVAPGAFVPNA